MKSEHEIRIILAKVGLDGHDRGIKVLARGLRDAGFHVIYSGLWQSPAGIARIVGDEDADILGLSILSGAHMTHVPRVLKALRDAGLKHVGVILGGTIPESDVPKLRQMGVLEVFGPGTGIPEAVEFLNTWRARGDD